MAGSLMRQPRPSRGTGIIMAADAVVVPSGVLRPGWIEVESGQLRAVAEGSPPRDPDLRLPGGWLLPGFVDLHVHGGGGGDMSSGRIDAVAAAVEFHRTHGTTTMVASLVTASLPELHTAVIGLADMVDKGLVGGIHLEGPWLSSSRCGAQDRRLLRSPEPAEVEKLLKLGRGRITAVTVAPELEGGLEAIRRIVDSGALAAIGHTEAGYDMTRRAIVAGARVATHLFNAMPSIHHRDPGPIPALLEAEDVSVELVLDGVHIHPAVAALAAERAGPDRTLLITDAMSAAGTPDGSYRLGTVEVSVANGVARLGNGALAGSTLTMDTAWRFAVQECGMSPHSASCAASTNPARLLGLGDVTGALVPGLRADVVALDASMHVQGVMVAGAWLE
jgi:N-acetylglucosamine-6-phosphate deacetylase